MTPRGPGHRPKHCPQKRNNTPGGGRNQSRPTAASQITQRVPPLAVSPESRPRQGRGALRHIECAPTPPQSPCARFHTSTGRGQGYRIGSARDRREPSIRKKNATYSHKSGLCRSVAIRHVRITTHLRGASLRCTNAQTICAFPYPENAPPASVSTKENHYGKNQTRSQCPPRIPSGDRGYPGLLRQTTAFSDRSDFVRHRFLGKSRVLGAEFIRKLRPDLETEN